MPVDLTVKPEIKGFFDPATNTISYVVKAPSSQSCAIVDSVMDIDYAAGRITYDHADEIIAHVRDKGLTVEWLIETHVHADHLSASPYIQRQLGGKIGIGRNITVVQDTFGKVFNEGTEFQRDGSQFDRLFDDGDTYKVGQMSCTALHTPGHTPACMTHVMGDAAFVGDTLFMPDYGTARADFPGGDAATLYRSIHRILDLPAGTRVFVGHDYLPAGRTLPAWDSTVDEQRVYNVHVHDGVSEAEFVAKRTARDRTLAAPALILPSLQVNIRAGDLPPEEGGRRYLRLPVNALGS
jgi:glyoxylase-like metal-dependent hydrolase (beta-lactamase superfamily II)